MIILCRFHRRLSAAANSWHMLLLNGAGVTPVRCAGRDFEHVLKDFSSATAPAAEEQQGLRFEDLLRFAAAVAGTANAGTAPVTPPGPG